MFLRDAIAALEGLALKCPITIEEAQQFLDQFPISIQRKLIAAIYTGRSHIQSTHMTDEITSSEYVAGHIRQDEFAQIIKEKCSSIFHYLQKLQECASNSGFDLESL